MERATLSLPSPQPWAIVRQSLDLEEVFARFVDPVYRFLYSRLGNREDAEDLTAEVFLKASRHLETGRADASVAAWLFRVARTVLADHWRRYYRAVSTVRIGDADMAELADAPGPEERSEELGRRVAAILDRLPARSRRVLELRFLHGYSIAETAQELGITPQNVKVIQHRALARAAQLGEELL